MAIWKNYFGTFAVGISHKNGKFLRKPSWRHTDALPSKVLAEPCRVVLYGGTRTERATLARKRLCTGGMEALILAKIVQIQNFLFSDPEILLAKYLRNFQRSILRPTRYAVILRRRNRPKNTVGSKTKNLTHKIPIKRCGNFAE